MAAVDLGSKEDVSSPLTLRMPLSHHKIDVKAFNKLANNAQTREKLCKIIQYFARTFAYFLRRAATERALFWSGHLGDLAKKMGSARRSFKLFRWVRHIPTVATVKAEKSRPFRALLALELGCNASADLLEDFTSLEKLGFVTKGTLPKKSMKAYQWAKLWLSVVEVVVTAVKLQRATAAARAKPGDTSLEQKLALTRLDHSSHWANIAKNSWDCELRHSNELAYCLGGAYSGLIGFHKQALKALGK